MSVTIEARAYGPESTEAERQAIQDRVSVYRENILLIQTMPVTSVFSLELYDQRVRALTAGKASHYLLVDLRGSQRLDAACRAVLQDKMKAYPPVHAAIFNAESPLFTIAAKFLFALAGVTRQSVHATWEQALERIERARSPS